ncbi:putative malate dehydrogenase [Helianthus anomalus]
MRTTMLKSIRSPLQKSSSTAAGRWSYSSESASERKVAILGAAGGFRQPLSLLMKLNPLVSSLFICWLILFIYEILVK